VEGLYPGSTKTKFSVVEVDGLHLLASFLSSRGRVRVCASGPVDRKWHNPVTYRWITGPVIHNVVKNASA